MSGPPPPYNPNPVPGETYGQPDWIPPQQGVYHQPYPTTQPGPYQGQSYQTTQPGPNQGQSYQTNQPAYQGQPYTQQPYGQQPQQTIIIHEQTQHRRNDGISDEQCCCIAILGACCLACLACSDA